MTRQMRRALLPLVVACLSMAAGAGDDARRLGRDIFKELIEINTTDSIGNTTTAANAMAKRLRDAGFPASDVRVLGPNDRKGNMVARLRGSGTKKPVLVLGHLDVVEARREDWTTDPFQFVEKDGYFYGRGTQDMKGEDAQLVTTFIRLKKEGHVPDRDLILALTADEAGGTFNGVAWLLKEHRDLVDAGFALNFDAGGVTTVKGQPVNVDLEATEKQYADFQLTVTNPGGHSSLPTPDNAIYHLADALGRLEKSPFPFELNDVTRTYFERRAALERGQTKADMLAITKTPADMPAVARLSADPRFNSMMRTTCVATMLSGGHAPNALPQRAQANVNCRILPGHSPSEVQHEIERVVADPQVVLTLIGGIGGAESKGFPTALPPPDVMRPLEKVAADMWPGAPVIPEMETGASDSVHTVAAGIPSFGFNGIALDQDDIRAHGRDERVRVASYDAGVEFTYRFLKALTSQF